MEGSLRGILLLGARQVGKTTLLRHLLSKAQYVVFDPVQDLYNARQDPDLFLQPHPTPLILDEVQFVPELLATLKRVMDESSEYGQYYLTGSQNFSVLKQACESLAGRVAIIELDPLGIFEQHGIALQDTWINKLIFENHPLNAGQFSLIDTPCYRQFGVVDSRELLVLMNKTILIFLGRTCKLTWREMFGCSRILKI